MKKKCNRCGGIREVTFIGKSYNDKIFESKCIDCGYEYMFIINKNIKKYYRTGNLQNA